MCMTLNKHHRISKILATVMISVKERKSRAE